MLQYIIAFLVIMGFLFFFIRKPTVSTYIKYTLWTFPFTDTKILPLEYGLVKVFDVLTLIAFIFLFKEFLTLQNRKTNLGYLAMVVLFSGISLIGKYFSEFPLEKAWMLYPLVTLFIFTRFLIHYLYVDFKRRYELFHILKIGFVCLIGVMLLQLFLGPGLTYYTEVHGNALGESISTTRFPGLFIDSQSNGQFMAMASFFFLLMHPNIENSKKYLGYVGFSAMAICVVLAGSRSALGGFFIGVILFFIFANIKTKVIMGLLGVLTFGILIFAQPKTALFGRTESVGEDFLFRESIWIETLDIIEQHPVLGIGMGNYQKYLMKYHQDLNLVIEPGVEYYYFSQPENGHLKIMVEQGIPAFLLFALLVLLPFFKSIFGLLNRSVSDEVRYILCAIIAFSAAFNTVYSFIDYRLSCLLGILICLAILYSDSRESTFILEEKHLMRESS